MKQVFAFLKQKNGAFTPSSCSVHHAQVFLKQFIFALQENEKQWIGCTMFG
jgi:hypothetical protein